MDIRENRQFACELCELRFTTKQFLQRHLIVHTEERNYPCTLCPNSYKYKKGLNRHYKKVHYPQYHKQITKKLSKKANTTQEGENQSKQAKKPPDPPSDPARIALLDITKIIITSPFPVS